MVKRPSGPRWRSASPKLRGVTAREPLGASVAVKSAYSSHGKHRLPRNAGRAVGTGKSSVHAPQCMCNHCSIGGKWLTHCSTAFM